MNKCTDCGKKISKKANRCHPCDGKSRRKEKNRCIDCGKKILKASKRCYSCEDESRRKEMNTCIDCNKVIGRNTKRCRPCKNKLLHKETNKCINCGKKITRQAKRCRLCADELQRKEKNRCIDCNKEVSRKNVRRCRHCSDIARHKKSNKCIDCGIKISKSAKRCVNCQGKYFSGKNHTGYCGGRNFAYCVDCGKKTKSYSAKKCMLCYRKSRYIEKNKCIDCNKEICRDAKRCRPCRAKNSRIEKPKCIDCGKKLSRRDAKRCAICKIREIFKNIRHKKNKPEKFIEKMLNKTIPKEYKYVGDGKFWIEKYNPDFINMNGQKKIIEFFGDYWHTTMKGCEEKDRRKIKTYKKYGYDCLIIRTKDLREKNLENRILDFNNIKKMGKFNH